MSQLVTATANRRWLTIKKRRPISETIAMPSLSDIANILEREAIDADLSALHVKKTAALVGLSDVAAAFEVARWQRRAGRMQGAAATIRELIGQHVEPHG